MHLYRRTTGIFLLLVFSLASYGQQSYSKTLLWRISGRGLKKPSYLFGTMHLNDKRLFRFDDSVYHAIEQTEGLAIEINPDEMAAYYVNKLFDQIENSKKIQNVLKENDFKKYSSALAKKFNKPATEITTNDVVREKNKWMADYLEKGEMPTFVDAYLYNIARRQGKWLGGIEDIADQAGLLEGVVDKSDIDYLLLGDSASNTIEANHTLDKMITLYSNQDIEGIETFTNGQTSPTQKDQLLITRNIKMARRIDSLINLRTMFLAIGTAHLPGDSGVIHLLRNRGFIVEPVISSKKIDVKDYTFKEVHLPWFQVDDSQGLYQTFMPGNPATVKLYGLIEMKFLMDIFNMSGFCTMAVISPSGFTNKDSIYNMMAQRMFQTEAPQASKIINNDGIEGREYNQVKKGANIRLRMFIYNNVVYLSFMYSVKAGPTSSDDANKFFASFSINKSKIFSATETAFTDSVMGISFVAPAAVAYNKKLSINDDESWKISSFTGTDMASGSYIMLYSKELKPGHYVPSDSLIYDDFYEKVKKQYHILQKDERFLQGCRVVRFSGRSTVQPNLYMNALNILQNGRDIVLLTISDSVHLHAPALDHMFESLQLIPHPVVEWNTYASPDHRFSCQVPAPVRTYTGRLTKEQFFSYDTTTSLSYSIIPDTLGKYFWAKDDSSFWKKRVVDNLGDDSLLQETTVRNGDLQGIELLAKESKNATRYKRMRLLVDGDKLYKIFVSAEKDYLYSGHVNRFFTSFSVNTPRSNSHFITIRKTELLLSDLSGGDSATRLNAYTGLQEASFTEKDRDALQQMLFKKYLSLYGPGVSTVINYEIANKLAALNSTLTVDFVRARYLSFTDRKDTLKNISLSLLAQLHSKESYAAFAELLQQSAPREPFDYACMAGLKDSLLLTAAIYPVLQQLAPDTVHAASIADIANELLDSGFIQQDKIKSAENNFIKAAKDLLHSLVQDKSGNYQIYQLITLLGRFNDAPSNKVLRGYLAVKEPYLQKAAALQLIKNRQPVAAAVLNGFAADKGMRYNLYLDLKKLKKKALFPARYLTQSYFAESAVYNSATEDDDSDLSDMVFLLKKAALYKGRRYVFYLYKVTFMEEEHSADYLGIAGAYTATGMALEPAMYISGIYRDKPFDAKNINALLDEYLESIEKYNSEIKPE